MKPITEEWIQKAEGDFATAQRESRVKDRANYDAVCFHGQQCAEKYLKARLQEAGISFPRIHDLTVLLDLALPIEPTWEALREDLHPLTAFAVEYRYPGECANESEATEAVEACAKLRHSVRQALALDPNEPAEEDGASIGDG
jgi:HEPN domain-containing protein